MSKIDWELQECVNEKRKLFLTKLNGLGLPQEVINDIDELAYSMEKANVLGETELGLHYKEEIKRLIISNRQSA